MDTSKIPPPIKDPEIKHTQVRTDILHTLVHIRCMLPYVPLHFMLQLT